MENFMLRAIIFDFDGVIADVESLHLKAFNSVLSKEGVKISEKEYYESYLALDDRSFFETVFRDYGIIYNNKKIRKYLQIKSNIYKRSIDNNLKIFPGVPEFIADASKRYILAIGSGALRSEIEMILKKVNLLKYFNVIVSADEVENCKPDPQVFIEALRRINDVLEPKENEVYPQDCVVIEDSVAGMRAARAANMRCIAVTNSYSEDYFKDADMVVSHLSDINLEDIEQII